MRRLKFASALLISVFLVSCGGGGDDIPAKPTFTSQVSFGDSLSDVGSYKEGYVLAVGGGQFTVNIPGTPTNWTQMTAAKFGLTTTPCAAWVGLDDGTGTPSDTNVTVVPHNECTGYAQGGALVTDAAGIHNKDAPYEPGSALTYSVSQQITAHLTRHGDFTGDEIVFVMAGANDLLVQMNLGKKAGADAVNAAVAAQVQDDIANNVCTPTDLQATNCIPGAIATLTPAYLATLGANTAGAYYQTNSLTLGGAMVAAATQLSGYVDDLITAKAEYIVVINMPDVASTPALAATPALVPFVTGLIDAFNSTLQAAVAGKAKVLYVDAYTASHDEVANPSKYNLVNVTEPACDMSAAESPALVCSLTNLATGVTPSDIGGYLFSDDVHPTPYGHLLFATYVLQEMTNKGWY